MTLRKKPKRTAYERVKRAALEGRGCHLGFDECFALYMFDDAFRERADLDEADRISGADPRPFKGDAS